MADLEQKFTAWRQRNPLKVWREKNGVSQTTIAAATGVSTNMVIKWESGSSTPSDDRMERLAQITGEPEFKQAWDEWLAAALAIK